MSSPESGWNQEIVPIYQHFFTLFYHLNSPCPVCSIRETSTQTQARQFLGTLVRQLLCLLAFQIESLFLASATDVSHGERYELGLSNKIVLSYLSYDSTQTRHVYSNSDWQQKKQTKKNPALMEEDINYIIRQNVYFLHFYRDVIDNCISFRFTT